MSNRWVGIALAATMVTLFVIRFFLVVETHYPFYRSKAQTLTTVLFVIVVFLLVIHVVTREEQKKKALIKKILSSLLGLLLVTVAILIKYVCSYNAALFQYVAIGSNKLGFLFTDMLFLGSLLLMSNIAIRKKHQDGKAVYLWQILGSVGSVILFIGVFCPIFGQAIFLFDSGGVEYFWQREGWFILSLAIVSFFLALSKQYHWLLITGFTSLSMMAYTYISLLNRISPQKSRLFPPRDDGIGQLFVSPSILELRWGWIVLTIGVVLIIGVGLIGNPPLKRKD